MSLPRRWYALLQAGKRKAHLLRELDIQDGNGLQLGYVPRRAATTASRALSSPKRKEECGALAVGSTRKAPASRRSAAAAAAGPPSRTSAGKRVSTAQPAQATHKNTTPNACSVEASAACGASLPAADSQVPNLESGTPHNPVTDSVISLKIPLPSPVGRLSRHRPALPTSEPSSFDAAAAATLAASAETASPTDNAASGVTDQDRPLSVVGEDSAAPAAHQLRTVSSKSVPHGYGRRVYPRGRLKGSDVDSQPAGTFYECLAGRCISVVPGMPLQQRLAVSIHAILGIRTVRTETAISPVNRRCSYAIFG